MMNRTRCFSLYKSSVGMLLLAVMMLVLVGFFSCKPAVKTNTCNNRPATLVFGQGGGITGKYTEYLLVSDRNLYLNDPKTGETKWLKKIDKKSNRQFFIDAESLGLMTLKFNTPCNMNFYITFIKGVKQNKVNWGNAQNPPPAGVKELWDQLWALTR